MRTQPELSVVDDGVTIFKGALTPEQVAALKAAADYDYSLMEGEREVPDSVAGIVAAVAEGSKSWGGIPIDHYLSIAETQTPGIRDVFSGITQKLCALAKDATDAPAITYRSEISYVRRHTGTGTHAPWHFDCYAAGTLGHDPCYNAWVPFVAVGGEFPSLEFLIGSHKAARAGTYEKKVDGYPTDEWMASSLNDDSHVCFQMEPGDVLVFDHYTMHRTQPVGRTGKIRTSAELRLTGKV